MKKAYGILVSVGILVMSARSVFSWVGTKIGRGGGLDLIGIGFFAACLVICVTFFLFPVWLLKRRYGPRQLPGGVIPYLPFSASFHLADAGETIGRKKSVLAGERDGEPTFRPFSFP